MRLIVSPPAQRDLADILLYTLQQYGSAQEEKYAAALDNKLNFLRDHPTAGRLRPELGEGYRSLRVNQPIIYYALTDTAVYIARILHSRMDARRHLS